MIGEQNSCDAGLRETRPSILLRNEPRTDMTKIDKAVVLAAGRGTRMRELTVDFTKPMNEVRGKQVLQHIF